MAIKISRRKIASYYAEQLIVGTKLSTLTLELAAYLIESKRTKELELVVRDIEFALAQRGVVVADVVTAHELSAATRTAIIELAKKSLSAHQVELRDHIDPTVIGGIKLDLAGLRLDSTIKQKLTLLSAQYKN